VTDILKLTYYIVDFAHTQPRHRIPLMNFLGSHRPPTTLVPVPKLAIPEIIFEIEATAAIPQEPLERVDVAIIGAGLSGLQAARDLQQAGLKVRVFEARDRVGGKTWSRPARGSVCDVGAAWINDSNQSKMFALAQRYGLDLVMQNTDGKIIVDDGVGKHKVHPYGELLADAEDREDIEDIVRVRGIFEDTLQKIDISKPVVSGRAIRQDLDSITFEDWVRSLGCREHALNALKIGTRAMLGVEPCDMSALYFLDYCKAGGGYLMMRSDRKDGGQYLRIAEGTQSFSRGLAGELTPGTLMLQSPVRLVEQRPGGVRVVSSRGIVDASRVIVSVPTPLYKEITFDPPLPADKLAMAQTTKLGDYCKMIVLYEKPWWRESDLCGLTQSVHRPFAVTRDTSLDAHGHYSLTCFVVGEPARQWMLLDAKGRQTAVLDQISRIFGPFAKVENPVEIVEQIWQNEQWSQGCPCPVMAPGMLTKYEDVLRATFGKLHFVGTETAFEWKGYMEGAVRSGERGAQEVMLALNRSKL
jgi:monoamine oxidase